MKKKENNIVEKIVSNVAYTFAEKSVNASCTWFFYQPKLSEKVKSLRKY